MPDGIASVPPTSPLLWSSQNYQGNLTDRRLTGQITAGP